MRLSYAFLTLCVIRQISSLESLPSRVVTDQHAIRAWFFSASMSTHWAIRKVTCKSASLKIRIGARLVQLDSYGVHWRFIPEVGDNSQTLWWHEYRHAWQAVWQTISLCLQRTLGQNFKFVVSWRIYECPAHGEERKHYLSVLYLKC